MVTKHAHQAPAVATPATYDGCAAVSGALALAARGERSLSLPEQQHLGSCLRCRAEQLRYRRLMDAMRALRESLPHSDPQLESEILSRLESHGGRIARRVSSQTAAAVGGVAAGAAAVAGLIALAARHRRVAALTS